MHQKTFDRLYLKYQLLDMAIDDAFVNHFAALAGESWSAK